MLSRIASSRPGLAFPRRHDAPNLPFSRRYHDYVRFATPGGGARIPLNSPKIIGVANSRGTREYQEDFYAFVALSLNPEELRLTVQKKLGVDWNPESVGEPYSRQAVFVGIYDGHGGSSVSQWLRQELHGRFESVDKSQIPEMIPWIREIGGYFRRFRGGPLAPWENNPEEGGEMDLEARATLAFFDADRHLSVETDANACGATASVAILHALDSPATPFFSSKKLALTVAHVGDTRVILCAADGCIAHTMTEAHHADGRTESNRLRRMMGSSLITDSFGESRWMGALANTRCLGDLRYKPFGVTPEPQVQSKLLENEDWAYVVLVSDGVSSVVSDDEIVDLARHANTPKEAAQRVLSYAEDMGSDDNGTVIVVPLSGWGKVRGPDKTQDLRAYRRTQMIGSERQRRM